MFHISLGERTPGMADRRRPLLIVSLVVLILFFPHFAAVHAIVSTPAAPAPPAPTFGPISDLPATLTSESTRYELSFPQVPGSAAHYRIDGRFDTVTNGKRAVSGIRADATVTVERSAPVDTGAGRSHANRVRFAFSRASFTYGNVSYPLPSVSLQVLQLSTGQVLEASESAVLNLFRVPLGDLIIEFWPVLPDRPVAIGDSWRYTARIRRDAFDVVYPIELSFVNTLRAVEGNIAMIETTHSGSLEHFAVTSPNGQPGLVHAFETGTGTIYFDMVTRRFRAQYDYTITIKATVGGVHNESRSDGTMTIASAGE